MIQITVDDYSYRHYILVVETLTGDGNGTQNRTETEGGRDQACGDAADGQFADQISRECRIRASGYREDPRQTVSAREERAGQSAERVVSINSEPSRDGSIFVCNIRLH